MHEELKIEEVTPMPKVEECTFQLNKEMEATKRRKYKKYDRE